MTAPAKKSYWKTVLIPVIIPAIIAGLATLAGTVIQAVWNDLDKQRFSINFQEAVSDTVFQAHDDQIVLLIKNYKELKLEVDMLRELQMHPIQSHKVNFYRPIEQEPVLMTLPPSDDEVQPKGPVLLKLSERQSYSQLKQQVNQSIQQEQTQQQHLK